MTYQHHWTRKWCLFCGKPYRAWWAGRMFCCRNHQMRQWWAIKKLRDTSLEAAQPI